MGRDLMTLDCFRESIMRSDSALRPYGINVFDLLIDSKEDTFNDTVISFVGIVGIQVIFHVSYSRNEVFISCAQNRPKACCCCQCWHTLSHLFERDLLLFQIINNRYTQFINSLITEKLIV